MAQPHSSRTAWRKIGPAAGTLLAMLGPATHVVGQEEPGRTPHLLYMLTDPNSREAQSLTQCDRLTVEQYRKHGVRVTERTQADLEKWLAGEGAAYAKAHKDCQHVAYAKSNRADAIGGLSCYEGTQEVARLAMEAGPFFEPWGISLSGCWRTRPAGGVTEIQAISLGLGSEFSIPRVVDPHTWSIAMQFYPAHGVGPRLKQSRSFLGVRLDGARITQIVEGSPADVAGLKIGDEITSVDGESVNDPQECLCGLGTHDPGTALDFEYRRGDSTSKQRITLASRYDFFPGPVGKPIPDLEATDIAGRTIRLTELKDKVVFLDFWATSMVDIMEHLALRQVLWEQLKDRPFAWVSVSIDKDEQAWREFIENNQLGGVQMRAPEWAEMLQIPSYPAEYLIDGIGNVVHEGFNPSEVLFLLSKLD